MIYCYQLSGCCGLQLESCKSENEMLTKQLEQARRDKSNLDLEFANYRKQTQVRNTYIACVNIAKHTAVLAVGYINKPHTMVGSKNFLLFTEVIV